MSIVETEPVAAPARAIQVAERRPATPAQAAAGGLGPAWWLEGRGFVLACLVADVLALTASVVIAAGGFGRLLEGGAVLALLLPLSLAALALRGTYSRTIGSAALDAIARLVAAIAIAGLVLEVLAVHVGSEVSGGRVALATGLAAVAVTLGRTGAIATQRKARGRGLVGRPTLIVGGGDVAGRIGDRLLENPDYGLRPIGFVNDPDSHAGAGRPSDSLPLLGEIADLGELAEQSSVEQVIVAFSGTRDEVLSNAVRDCERRGVAVSIVPRLFESHTGRVTYDRLGGLPLIGLHAVRPGNWRFKVKHAFDFVAALAGLLALAPLLAAIALAVRIESPGPIFFRQRRVGLDGRPFDLLKFRSMALAPDAGRFVPASGSAPGGVEGIDRRTRVGRILRRTSLDELPQLVNVLRGEMSLIGPRPERPEFVELFSRDIRRYDERHRVRAGLTGWAQVHGYRGQTSLTDRVEWDNYYIEHWSLGLDLRILVMTLAVLFQPSED
jgi:exopolysaccharide biosynthesis polyprenyl glycosylphosphotransferase